MQYTTVMPATLICSPISDAEFSQLTTGARVLERDKRGDKVLLCPDDHIIKLFYPRRKVSSARFFPYAYRFCINARKLQEKGVISVQCEQLRYDRQAGRHLVRYPLLSGDTLRDRLTDSSAHDSLLKRLSAYLAELHDKGILFRSVHLGNILVLADGNFGLIDIADMSIQHRSLGLLQRARNFRHLLHDQRDRNVLQQYGYDQLLGEYERAAGISGYRQKLLRRLIRHTAPLMSLTK